MTNGPFPTGLSGGTGPAPPAPRLRGILARLYAEEREAWRKHYRRYFKHAARALGLGFVVGFAFFMFQPAQEDRALGLVVKALKDIPLEASPLTLVLTLFYHNARATVIAAAAGLAPYLFLPILDPFLNGGVLGLLASVSKHQGLDVPKLFLTQILPHGLFELTAVLYGTSLGMYLSAEMGRKAIEAWKKRRGMVTAGSPPSGRQAVENFLETFADRADAQPPDLVRNIVRSFVLVVLPLLLVAAAVEGIVTPLLR